jgi:FtsZ-interacting cell division protein ZipA
MVKNQKGNVVVIAVIIIVIFAILGIGFWAISASKGRSSKLLNDRETVKQHTKDSQ